MPATATEAGRRALAARLSGLYALTPGEPDGGRLDALVDAALRGGARAIQYRNKEAAPGVRAAQAASLRRRCRAAGALFIVNDDPALAAAVDADGVHVGEHDGGIAAARAAVGEGRLVCASCYDDAALASAAVAAGADCVAFGSFFPSSVKPSARRADTALLGRARSLGVPVVAIGGIDATNAGGLVRAGASAVAVITAVFGSGSPREVEAAARAIAAACAAAATP